MLGVPSVSRPHRLLGLLLCLLGVASVSYSYFTLPLYQNLEGFGGHTFTGWQLTSGSISNMLIRGVTPSFLAWIGWTLVPLVAAALVGILGIARFAFVRPFLAVLYLIFWVLGSIVLALTLMFVIFGLRFGALGETVGYALCFWADRLWRGKRRAVNIWNPSV